MDRHLLLISAFFVCFNTGEAMGYARSFHQKQHDDLKNIFDAQIDEFPDVFLPHHNSNGQTIDQFHFGQQVQDRHKPTYQLYSDNFKHVRSARQEHGQLNEEFHFGQEPLHPPQDEGQKYEELSFGQKPVHPPQDEGQKYEELSFGQKPVHPPQDEGQKYEELGFGQKSVQPPQDEGQKYEELGFGQKSVQPPQDEGQKYEELGFGQKPIQPSGQIHEELSPEIGPQLADKNTDENFNLLQDFEKIHFGKRASTSLPNVPQSQTTDRKVDEDQQHLDESIHFQEDQSLVFPDFPEKSAKPITAGSSFRGGCNSRPPTPMNAVLKCSLYRGCKATCQKGHEFPNGDVAMFITCKGGEWKIGGDTWQVVPPCRPICLPACQHNGICIAPNQCQCPKNYGGPQCQYEKKPCLNYPPVPANSVRSCTTKSCTVACAKGYEFPDGSSITNLICKDGQWRLSRTDWVSLPDCRAVCDPPCINGGVCLSLNICQCPQQFTGPSCQYEMSACSGDKLHFNGIHNCTGNGEKLVCELRCPTGIQALSPIASEYTCTYATGLFQPQPIPSCDYGENVLVIPLNTSSKTYYTASQVERGTYHKQQENKKEPKQVSWDIVNLFETNYIKPVPGNCYIWGGSHVKNFDGGMYSFDSPCSFSLVKDVYDGSFEINMNNENCSVTKCSRSLHVLYQNTEYKIFTQDGVSQLLVDKKAVRIPTQLVGFTAQATPGPARSMGIILHSLDISITWNEKDFVSVSMNENMWNKTGGLCGNMNKVSTDDFVTKSGVAARSLEAFLDSWTVLEGELTCPEAPTVVSSCSGNVSIGHCELLLNNPHFAACREVLNVKPYYEACLWDECKCGSHCSCGTISAFVQQCKLYLHDPAPNWRTLANCLYLCPATKTYTSCGPLMQQSCGDIQTDISTTQPSACFEGCVCPKGTVLDGDTCILEELCPCYLRGKAFPSGSSIPKGCNTCLCNGGRWTCTEVRCGARCSSVGDPHYVTFDGRRFDFMGQCSYYLVRTGNFSIEAENVPCSGAISKAMRLAPGPNLPTCTKSLVIRLGESILRLGQNAEVYVNGVELTIFPHQDETFSIRTISSIFILIELDNGMEIWWDGVTSVYIDVPASLQGQTKGLCGTFNLNQKDDFLTPEGDVEQAVTPFANKWKTQEKCVEVVEKPLEHPCDRDPLRREKALILCSKLKSSIFTSCHWHVDVEPYYQNCLYDVCSCSGSEQSCLCPVLADYASECARENMPVVWRNEVRECGLHCPSGQTYQACGDTCTRSCQDISLFPNCSKRCVEGCNCPAGQTLDENGSCIPVAKCPCLYHNHIYNAGSQLVMENFKGPQFCTCINAVWDCRRATEEETLRHSEIKQIKARCSTVRNEEFTLCEPAEPVTCKNMHNPPQHTPVKCVPGCVCKKGFVWDFLGKRCLRANECPCHHGGMSYENGSSIQEDCNTCSCSGGHWQCTDRVCPAVCSTWGDSHFKTFDGRIFDFQGSCDFLLTGGTLSEQDVFDIKLKIIPCGSSGVSCPKSVTFKVGKGELSEEIVLTKGRTLPSWQSLNRRISVREAGLFIFVEVFDLGLVLQWDRGTRIYVRADPRWRNKVKGLCGNMNNDEQDDLSTPSGGISEVSPVLFADSWRLHPYCPVSSELSDPCDNNPKRRSWAITKCNILKSSVFQACHSEVPLDPYVKRCIMDTCGCDEGGDCECLCAAVAAYAQECSLHGVPIRWRSQEMCPLQCDRAGSKYSQCVSTCPVKTCDNMLMHNSLTQICGQESCVEGCEEVLCPNNQVFSNSSLVECVNPSICKTACLTVDNITFFEGDFMEGDDCHSCYCSRYKKVCSGMPCTTPLMTTSLPTKVPFVNDESPTCVSGWTSWINLDHPIQEKKKTDYEDLPTASLLMLAGSPAHCNQSQMKDIRCRDSWDLTHYKETGYDVECSLERGLRCYSTTTPCPDFEISLLCDCHEVVTTSTTLSSTTITTNISTAKPVTVHPTPNEPECPFGEKWVECAIPCNRTCHFFGHYLVSRGMCSSPYDCLPGCQAMSWEPCQSDHWLRDAHTCVSRQHCTCRSDSGDMVKPGVMLHESECGKCQCINNQYECDFTACFKKYTQPPSTTPSTRQDKNLIDVTLPGIRRKDFGNVTLIYLTTPSTVTPPPKCFEERYHSLLERNENIHVVASSVRDENAQAVKGIFKNNARSGSWTAGRENFDQYLQVDLGDIEAVYGVVVAGDPTGHFVTSFRLLYSTDGVAYRYISTPDNINEVFRGPIDGTHPVKQILPTPVEARFIRFNPFTWHGAMSMRVDVLACGGKSETTTEWMHIVTNLHPACDSPMGLDTGDLPIHSVTVSSFQPGHGPEHVRLSSQSAWKPLTSSQLEYITVDLLQPRNVTGIETKGMPQGNDVDSFRPESWVESFRLVYSVDGVAWNSIFDKFGKEKVFLANFNADSLKKNWFDLPIKARYIKFIPMTWRHEIAVRLELMGCYESYPVTVTPALVPETSSHSECNVCPGVIEPKACSCANDHWWDGMGCTSRSECPCIVGHISYAVGSVFQGENCDECTCKVNGMPICVAKSCPPCPLGLRRQLTPSCGCLCKPCGPESLLCPTTGVCIPEKAWCDGVQDCPDDETNCTAYVEEPKITCNATCPPDYTIMFTTEPQDVEIFQSIKYKGSKKGIASKTWKPKKTGKPVKGPNIVKSPPTCPPYECIPLPTMPPTECPQPSCPLNFTVERQETHATEYACPRYSCQPVPERAFCLLSGRTFTTFDGVDYKYDVCDHILAADIKSGDWSISVFKTCKTIAPCGINLAISHNHRNIILTGSSMIEVDGFNYTVEQVDVMNSRTKEFNISRLGDSWIFSSNLYGVTVVLDARGNARVEVVGLKGSLSGLCGWYNGLPEDDKTRPDGKLGDTTNDFGHSWMITDSGHCDTKVCPVDIQEKALLLCLDVRKEPFSICEGVINVDHFVSTCLESTCSCLQSNKSFDECRCAAMLDFVMSCKNRDMSRDLAGWRLTHDCSVTCPPDMTFYDCYPYSCEASCENPSCFFSATACFSGCFCNEGLVRRGDKCVKSSECRDCFCDGMGESQYLGFDRKNFTFSGNCSYVAVRDVPASGVPNFQVVVSNKPCRDTETSQCTEKVAIFTRGRTIEMMNDHTKKSVVAIDGVQIEEYPLNNSWVLVERVPGSAVHVLLPTLSIYVSFNYPTFSISLPSHLYKNQTEGLCGNCNNYPFSNYMTSDELSDAWLVKSYSDKCSAPKVECNSSTYDVERCDFIQNVDIFGQCHALIEPVTFVNLCLSHLCYNGSVCESIEAYAKACRDAGVCIDWRTHENCALTCPPGLEYRPCTLGCPRTCENYQDLDAKPDTCPFRNVEGCFCPGDLVLVNGKCVDESWCKTCDDLGHHSGDTWIVDKCTNCSCQAGTVSCSHQTCNSALTICPEGFSAVPDSTNLDKCCQNYICVPNPTEPTLQCHEPVKPDCGFGQLLKLETDPVGCPQFFCRCKKAEECDELPLMDEQNLPVGMEHVVNKSGCCPRTEIICNRDKCPTPPQCPEHYQLLTTAATECCDDYKCEKPRNLCFYKPEHSEYGASGSDIIAKEVGSEWNDGPCKSCTCTMPGGEAEAECAVRECLSMESHPDHEEYELLAVPGNDSCCPDIVRIGCKHNSQLFKVGTSWTPNNDNCVTAHCVRNINGLVVKEIRTETCNTNCDVGWEYRNNNESCCGQCVQQGCVLGGVLYSAGQTWPAVDNCTTFSCIHVLGGYLVTTEAEKCPDLSDCPIEDRYQDGCCARCKITAPSLSNCAPRDLPAARTIQLIQEHQMYHGKCSNFAPVEHFTECTGACDSHTVYNQITWSHDNVCQCCQAVAYSKVKVPLTCDDGYIIEKSISVPSKCQCQSCGAP